MWIVFNKQDSPDCGFIVTSEEEAKRRCEEDDTLDYIWAGLFYKEFIDC